RLANKVISLKTGRKTVSTKNRLPATGSKMIEGTVVRAYPDGPTLHIGCTGHRPDRLKILAVLAFQFQRAVFRVLLKTPCGDLPSCQCKIKQSVVILSQTPLAKGGPIQRIGMQRPLAVADPYWDRGVDPIIDIPDETAFLMLQIPDVRFVVFVHADFFIGHSVSVCIAITINGIGVG